jgi:alkylhydroperoxidase family enzyme
MTDPLDELRAGAALQPAPGMEAYLEKVRTRAYSVTDEDVASLERAGFGEDEIFEQTVAVAVAEGFRRLDAAAAVIE